MKYIKRFKFSILAITIVIIIFAIYSFKQKIHGPDCNPLMQKFDEYMATSSLPIIEDPRSLCHGMYFGTDFTKLSPKWAIAKLTIENGNYIFKGIDTTGDAIWLSSYGIGNLSVNKVLNSVNEGKYYKIDMNNFCRKFFSIADSQMPSLTDRGIVEPIEVVCE